EMIIGALEALAGRTLGVSLSPELIIGAFVVRSAWGRWVRLLGLAAVVAVFSTAIWWILWVSNDYFDLGSPTAGEVLVALMSRYLATLLWLCVIVLLHGVFWRKPISPLSNPLDTRTELVLGPPSPTAGQHQSTTALPKESTIHAARAAPAQGSLSPGRWARLRAWSRQAQWQYLIAAYWAFGTATWWIFGTLTLMAGSKARTVLPMLFAVPGALLGVLVTFAVGRTMLRQSAGVEQDGRLWRLLAAGFAVSALLVALALLAMGLLPEPQFNGRGRRY
ncbi:MAG: hypothetical protein KIS79_09970, partial [Burkholderiales bacterium]|nr:hypothetical protein [Burkholderiales bacterium]